MSDSAALLLTPAVVSYGRAMTPEQAAYAAALAKYAPYRYDEKRRAEHDADVARLIEEAVNPSRPTEGPNTVVPPRQG